MSAAEFTRRVRSALAALDTMDGSPLEGAADDVRSGLYGLLTVARVAFDEDSVVGIEHFVSKLAVLEKNTEELNRRCAGWRRVPGILWGS
jgi:hypothetical protein